MTSKNRLKLTEFQMKCVFWQKRADCYMRDRSLISMGTSNFLDNLKIGFMRSDHKNFHWVERKIFVETIVGWKCAFYAPKFYLIMWEENAENTEYIMSWGKRRQPGVRMPCRESVFPPQWNLVKSLSGDSGLVRAFESTVSLALAQCIK